MNIPNFSTKGELLDFLIENKSALIAEKKFQIKKGDAFTYSVRSYEKADAEKAIDNPSTFEGNKIVVESVINTTNIMDSHGDVHIKGIWTKSVSESKGLYLLQEHQMQFDKIISDEVKAFVKEYSWKDLGLNADGVTQALMFKSVINKDRNQFMFDQYIKGYVRNHSVGMRYVKMDLAVNDPAYKEESALFDKYIGRVVNAQEAIDKGYFWVVAEAKVIEGSAVPMGSNIMTPTLEVNTKSEPPEGTHENEPQHSTHKTINTINDFKFNF